jgi:hypothetical protein
VGAYDAGSDGIHGFIYNPAGGGTYTTLDDPLAPGGTQALGINNAGQIVGIYFTFGGGVLDIHSFLYSGGIFITIDDPVANNLTEAEGINNNNQIVGALIDTTGGQNQGPGFLLTITPNPPPPPARPPT